MTSKNRSDGLSLTNLDAAVDAHNTAVEQDWEQVLRDYRQPLALAHVPVEITHFPDGFGYDVPDGGQRFW